MLNLLFMLKALYLCEGSLIMLKALSEEAALEQLHEAGLTDGLPVVIPTPEQ